MGLFNALKNILQPDKPTTSNDTQDFDRDKYNRMKEEIAEHFNSRFDFNSVHGIESIPDKPYNYKDDTLGNIEYVLQRKATEHKKNGRMDLAIACLRKANKIMPMSDMMYSEKDYMRLVEYLKIAGRFDEAREEERKLKPITPTIDSMNKEIWQETSQFNKEFETDLVKMSKHNCCCELCAKYQDRLFSVSGKDSRFPKLPDIVLRTGSMHEGCRHTFSSFLYGIQEFSVYDEKKEKWIEVDAIKYSNRPFIDDRTPEQKAIYEKNILDAETEIKDRKDYDYIREHLPEITPKSFGGYRRMKSTKSKNYLKLIEAAKEHGYNIDGSSQVAERTVAIIDSAPKASTYSLYKDSDFIIDSSDLYNAALEVVQMAGYATASLLQSRLSIDKQQANDLLNDLEQSGIIGTANGNLPRQLL